ncbi:MAG: hypothetical protein J7623_01645 [Chitinophaga sp.]|uniref:hypothetical protein n=1 Tax=Chitinophaga sp. TaxID=1869181 RepID=UPI001B283C02|nr:hypothetical protein [Chitinophaga sp.]MBO9727319.1 hypothetical protein [Chitinophaga sp.]
MKKAKILLLGVAIAATVGIACAYKANTTTTFFRNTGGGQCTVPLITKLTLANPFDPEAFTTQMTNFSVLTICPNTYVKVAA